MPSSYGASSYQSRSSSRSNRRQGYEDLSQGGSSSNGRDSMQTMEILSGGEYGKEFDESSSAIPLGGRWIIYLAVAFLLLIIVSSPKSATSDFKLPKNANNNTRQHGDNNDTSLDTTSTPSKSPISQSAQDGKWVETSPPETEDAEEFYEDICDVPKTYQEDSNNFTFLNASNFCLPEDQFVSKYFNDCRCKNPVVSIPNPDAPLDRWNQTFQMNIALANRAIAQPYQLDVVFLGDSITEHWNGRDGGEPSDQNVSAVFDKLFHKENGGEMEGIALGLAGDRCESLLYRIQHGEMPPALNPSVWWLLIGTNDLGVDNCDADAVAVGNIRIVEEIRKQHSQTPIVINSILPRDEEELLHSSPVWKVIHTINSKLECYADTHDNLHFFNATDLFVNYTKEGAFVNKTLQTDYIHPSGEGSIIWGKAIIKELQQISKR